MYIHQSLTFYQQNNKPDKIVRDSRGTQIESGLRVAFNRSGDVVLGTIVELKKNEWKKNTYGWRLGFDLEIIDENNVISRIKNPNSFVII